MSLDLFPFYLSKTHTLANFLFDEPRIFEFPTSDIPPLLLYLFLLSYPR